MSWGAHRRAWTEPPKRKHAAIEAANAAVVAAIAGVRRYVAAALVGGSTAGIGHCRASFRRKGFRRAMGRAAGSVTKLLRKADAHAPALSAGFCLAGIVLVTVGLCLAIWAIVRSAPIAVCTIVGGCGCLVLAAVANHRGLAELLPRSWRHLLLKQTPIDLLIEYPQATDLLRRWCRVFLLCQARSENDIQAIVKGVDPEFLDKIFRRRAIHVLPPGLRWLLWPDAGKEVTTSPGAPVSDAFRFARQCTPLSPNFFRTVLRKTKEGRRRLCSEPALSPVLQALLHASSEASLDVSARHLPAGRSSMHFRAVMATALSAVCITSAVFAKTPAGRSALSRGGRSTVHAGLFCGLFGACGSVVLTLFFKKFTRWWLPKVPLPPTRGEVRAVIPSSPISAPSPSPPLPPPLLPSTGVTPFPGGAPPVVQATKGRRHQHVATAPLPRVEQEMSSTSEAEDGFSTYASSSCNSLSS
eukprot:TRINITY_DN51756_c0_g1_i1.p1 TRINITY_DN51756_c0_g1~~TRINITY_DN51756_c0_g1_i1.p1  ORF type:complete len:470 (+),score=63.36 TRINITY_DN51756_c0_g1_i1:49-1458(+)